MDFPDPNDLLNFKLVIMPDEVSYNLDTCCTLCDCVWACLRVVSLSSHIMSGRVINLSASFILKFNPNVT